MFASTGLSLDEQIKKGMESARKRYGAEKFVAYFQNASGTYAPVWELKEKYDAIRKYPEIVGLYISTRPDCVDDEKLDLIKSYIPDYDVWVEYGVQSIHDRTLFAMNRGHGFMESEKAIRDTASRKIKVGVHLIMGLPGEGEREMLETARVISDLPVSGVKFHVLHILKGTGLEEAYNAGKIKLLAMDQYVDIICKALEVLPPDCVILRISPDAKDGYLVAPDWIKDKPGVLKALEKRLRDLKTRQGRLFNGKKF
jgi:radical SAM protein (TIGR01212 family)